MRIAFFGLPIAAWLLHRDGHEIVYAAISREGPGLRRVRRALGDRVQVKPDLSSRRAIERVAKLAPERIVSWFWTKRLPRALLDVAPGFGVHPSLLPRHRGPDPFFHAIDAGDRVTGVTAHRLADEYDTGAILAQREVAIDPSWNAWQLARALDRPSLALLRAVAKDGWATETPQDESRATLAPEPADEELELDWTWTSERLARRVRAAAPWPGAWTFFGDECVAVTRTSPAPSFPRALAPGEAAVVETADGPRAVVRTADGALALERGHVGGADGEPPDDVGAADFAALITDLQRAS